MTKKNSDLFDRLRQVGLRKQVAKTLSAISADAGKKAQRGARAAAAELRAIADEIDHRLLDGTPAKTAPGAAPTRASRSRATKARAAAPAKPSGATAKTPQRRAPTRRASTSRRSSAPPPSAPASSKPADRSTD